MAYSNFKLKEIERVASLKEEVKPLFAHVAPLEPSAWLQETLEKTGHLLPKSEKARSELILMPVLLEMLARNNYAFTIFSGENLEADAALGLNGECDFILGKGEKSYTIQSPIFALVEAKQNIVENSLGQCVAQMVGAAIFNKTDGTPITRIYGCVSNGSEWQFLRLENKILTIDDKIYFFNELEHILGILQNIIQESL
ncbi:MAG: hypothetical protein MUE30_09730 [Spirosomaceae bacterium]|jgi:hypothetical protein|nr:hypothetical protein [Spirosomataceae bacterium]